MTEAATVRKDMFDLQDGQEDPIVGTSENIRAGVEKETRATVKKQASYWKNERGYKILCVVIPMTGEHCLKRFVMSTWGMFCGDAYNVLMANKVKAMVYVSSDFPIDHGRNKAITRAREDYQADYILQLDADMTFPQDTIFRLFDTINTPMPDGTTAEIVSGMYYLKAPPFRPVCGIYADWDENLLKNKDVMDKWGFVCRGECGEDRHKNGGEHQLMRYTSPHYFPMDRPFRADVIGVGCVLSRASMWDKLDYPYFDYAPNFLDGGERNFAREVSEDMSWCARMHSAGIKVWMDPRVQCGHIGVLEANQSLYQGHFEMAEQELEKMPEDSPLKKEWRKNRLDLR